MDGATLTQSICVDPSISDLIPALKEDLGGKYEGNEEEVNLNLIKFLRWKQNVQRAAERIKSFNEWRKGNPKIFDSPALKASTDLMLQKLLEAEIIVAPKGLYDKEGNSVLIGKLRNNDMSSHGSSPEDVVRLIVYLIDRLLVSEQVQKKGVIIFHDLNGLSRKNLHLKIPRILLPALIGHFPIKIKGIYLLNAPFFAKPVFKMISLMLPAKLRTRMHFVNEISAIHEVIDKEKLPVEYGGKCTYDQKQWVKEQIQVEKSGTWNSLSQLPL